MRHRVGMYAEMWSDDARAGIAEQTPGPGLVYCFSSRRFLFQCLKFNYMLELFRIRKIKYPACFQNGDGNLLNTIPSTKKY